MSTMIALVSDQRMQNIIPLLQKGSAYDELVLVMSKERQTGEPLPKYRKAAKDLTSVLHKHLTVRTSNDFVDPYGIESVRCTISNLIRQCTNPSDVVVNISGGTKPMAIGAMRAAQTAGISCIYVDTEDNETLWLKPDDSTISEKTQIANLNVSLYIRAYGERVTDSKTITNVEETQKIWATIIGDQHKVIYRKVIVPMMTAIKQSREQKAGFPIVCRVIPTKNQIQIIEQLAQADLWIWNPISQHISITEPSAKFLYGTWVEIYAALQLQKSRAFDDIKLNIKLEGIEGEIDIAAVSNGKLVLVECKSNVQQSQQLSKLDSFRLRLGGSYAQAYYARASEANAPAIRKQCQKYRLNGVFFGAELNGMGEKISARMQGVA
ncbi:MAG: DUF1887 family protein [Anaerolineae bacterium]|nr:DUF1887 family protein [Anaerolineae bacterium]